MNKFIVCLLFIMLPIVSMAGTFTHEEHGYTIDVDDSFRINRSYDVTYFESEERDRIIAIRNWPGLSEEVAKNYLLQGYQDKDLAIIAVSDSQPRNIDVENGKALLVDVRGISDRRPVKGVAAGFIGNDGQGLVMLVSATEDGWGEFASEAEKITASVRFVGHRSGPGPQDWYSMLSGTRLTYSGKSDNRTRRENLNLCSDGAFLHRMSLSAMNESDSGSAMGYTTKTRRGQWEVVDDDGNSRLLLFYNDGRIESSTIDFKDGRIFLDGRRFEKLRKNSCR